LMSLFTLMDSGKVAIKYLVQGEHGVIRPLLRQRVVWGLAGLILGVGSATAFYSQANDIWLPVLVGALCVPIAQPTTLFAQINQARVRFRLNAYYNLIKFVTIVLAALLLGYFRADPIWFFCLYFILLSTFHTTFFLFQREAFEPDNTNSRQYRRESLQLSASGVFPILLEQADKFLVTYFFGLEVLGLYVIGVSTGRLLLHFVKPVLTIYFPILVKQRLSWPVLVVSFIALTVAGLLIAGLTIQFYFAQILGPEYTDAAPLAMVIVSGLGVYFIGVIVYYSAVYHEEGTARIPAITNIVTSTLIICYMLASLKFGGNYALILCAASYPLREFVNMIVINILTARSKKNSEAISAQ